MMKVDVRNAKVTVRFRKFLGGSVLKGTVFCRWDGVDTHLTLDSDAPPEKLAHLIRNAKAGCFAEGLIVQSVPLNSSIEVNGQSFDIGQGADGQK